MWQHPKPSPPMKQLAIRLPETLIKSIDEARKKARSKDGVHFITRSEYIRGAIEQRLNRSKPQNPPRKGFIKK